MCAILVGSATSAQRDLNRIVSQNACSNQETLAIDTQLTQTGRLGEELV